MTKHDWAKLLITGPVIEVRCDIAPGKVRLQYKEWPGACTDVASTESCSKVECHYPANPPALTPAEPITMRSGSVILTLPTDGKTYSVAADGTCVDTVEIEVGAEKVIVPSGAPIAKCKKTYSIDGKNTFDAEPVSAGQNFGVLLDEHDTGMSLRAVCLADPGITSLVNRVDSPEELSGPLLDCFAADLRSIVIGGKRAAVSSFRFAPVN